MKPIHDGNGKSNGAFNGHPAVWSRLDMRHTDFDRIGAGEYILITGGAGFVGTNVASHYLSRGSEVAVFDNLSRPGVERNLEWLRKTYGRRVHLIDGDVRDAIALRDAVRSARRVFHFAAQVAVTTSLVNPRDDFEVNTLGTLNVLEACRALDDPPPLLFTSTNKVYGDLGGLELECHDDRYVPTCESLRRHGVDETQPLDFHSPYGCSKGAADQYVLDYARCFGLPAVVFRMSCIYGPHQCGTEDQGWVAHFAREVLAGRNVTFYGDGCQVRDVLFVEDLVHAMELATDHIRSTAGRAFNMGGGVENAVSLRDVVAMLAEHTGRRPCVEQDAWRQGDQKYYVSDTRTFEQATGWRPRIAARQGIARLCRWLSEQFPRLSQAAVV